MRNNCDCSGDSRRLPPPEHFVDARSQSVGEHRSLGPSVDKSPPFLEALLSAERRHQARVAKSPGSEKNAPGCSMPSTTSSALARAHMRWRARRYPRSADRTWNLLISASDASWVTEILFRGRWSSWLPKTCMMWRSVRCQRMSFLRTGSEVESVSLPFPAAAIRVPITRAGTDRLFGCHAILLPKIGGARCMRGSFPQRVMRRIGRIVDYATKGEIRRLPCLV